MALRNILIIISLVLGFVLGNIFYSIFIAPDFEEYTETKQKSEIKVEWVERDTTIYNYRDSVIYNYKDSTIISYKIESVELSDKPSMYDSIRTYSNIYRHLYGYTSWRAKIGGELISMELNPYFKVPIKTIDNTIETTKTVVLKPKGLYGVGGITDSFTYSVGATYLNDRSMFGYRYNIPRQEHSIETGFLLYRR